MKNTDGLPLKTASHNKISNSPAQPLASLAGSLAD